MRGIVTLAAALALPVTMASGAPFPFRAEIILISFVVILATLVFQGLSLPPLIRVLRVEEGRGFEEEEQLARKHAATAALIRLDQLVGEDWLRMDHVERLRDQYGRQLERVAAPAAVDGEGSREASEAFQRLRHETLTAERMALIGLRNDGEISDEVLHQLEHELDVEALRLGIGERREAR
jgi:CPA1 family monovalent cation:H+ antiporter